jgi:hypothetical protein
MIPRRCALSPRCRAATGGINLLGPKLLPEQVQISNPISLLIMIPLASAEDREDAIIGVPETLADRASTNLLPAERPHADRMCPPARQGTRLATSRSSVSIRMLRLRSSATRMRYDEANPEPRGLVLKVAP